MRSKKTKLCDVLSETSEMLREQGDILDRTKTILLALQKNERKKTEALELQLIKVEIETALLTRRCQGLEKRRRASTARNTSQFFYKANEAVSGASFSSFTAVNRSPFK